MKIILVLLLSFSAFGHEWTNDRYKAIHSKDEAFLACMRHAWSNGPWGKYHSKALEICKVKYVHPQRGRNSVIKCLRKYCIKWDKDGSNILCSEKNLKVCGNKM